MMQPSLIIGGSGGGLPGTPDRSVELQTTETAIQWRQTGGEWQDLVRLAHITGTDGDPGDPGESVELRKTATAIQWRQLPDGVWTDLVLLADLKGEPGENGVDASTAIFYVAGMSAVSIPAETTTLNVIGYAAPGDAPPAIYRKVGAQPGHTAWFQSLDGAWWELAYTGSVHAAHFGAFPQVGLDVAAALNNAVSYLVSKGGGVINLSGGIYYVAGEVTIKSKILFRGSGTRVTCVYRKLGYLGDMFKTENFDTLVNGDTAGGPHRFGLYDITLNGQKDANPTAVGWCLRIYGRAYTIRNLEIEYCAGGGFYSRWGKASAAWDNDNTDSIMEATIDGLFIQFSKDAPVFDGPHDSQVRGLLVSMSRHNQEPLAGSSTLTIGDRAGGTQFLSLHAWGPFAEWCVTNWSDAITIADLVLDDARGGGGLLRQIGNQCIIQGRGIQFGTEPLTGLQIGQGGAPATWGNKISLVITGIPGISIAWGNDGGNDIQITCNATVAIATRFTGTRHASTTIQYYERGAGANAASPYLMRFGAFAVTAEGVQFPMRDSDPVGLGSPEGTIYYNTSMKRHRTLKNNLWSDV